MEGISRIETLISELWGMETDKAQPEVVIEHARELAHLFSEHHIERYSETWRRLSVFLGMVNANYRKSNASHDLFSLGIEPILLQLGIMIEPSFRNPEREYAGPVSKGVLKVVADRNEIRIIKQFKYSIFVQWRFNGHGMLTYIGAKPQHMERYSPIIFVRKPIYDDEQEREFSERITSGEESLFNHFSEDFKRELYDTYWEKAVAQGFHFPEHSDKIGPQISTYHDIRGRYKFIMGLGHVIARHLKQDFEKGLVRESRKLLPTERQLLEMIRDYEAIYMLMLVSERYPIVERYHREKRILLFRYDPWNK